MCQHEWLMVDDWVGQIDKVFHTLTKNFDGRVNWFSDVLQAKHQRKGSMVDGKVDSFGKVSRASKRKR
jgi:hypothetical protein